MKKLLALFALMGILAIGTTSSVVAQDIDTAVDTAMAQTDSTAVEEAVTEEVPAEPEGGIYKALKIKYIEGSAFFMSFVSLALVLGLAFCIERIIYLNLSETNSEKLLKAIEEKLLAKDVEGAKEVCRNTRGPIASIFYQGLIRYDEGIDVIEKSVVSYGGVQAGLLEKNLPWISLFIALSPSLGFLGTVIGMIQAFDNIQRVGDISPTVVAGGMKVALITTVYGLISAMILQLFYNYILTKIDAITNDMEDASISLLDILVKAELKK